MPLPAFSNRFKERDRMRCLITGGVGFIGSNLVEKLLDRGWEVTVLDDLSTGKRENIASFMTGGRLRLIVGSVTDR
jgi:nucleoside-diphosphate-sugar epimerase